MGIISEFFNFENIGDKIKNFAKWSFWITTLLIWIAALVTFIVLVSNEFTAYLWWIPLVSAIVFPVFVWIGSWTTYAFGELVKDIHATRTQTAAINSINKNLCIIAQLMIDEAAEKTKRMPEEKTEQHVETIAMQETEEKTKQHVETIAMQETEKKTKQHAEAIAVREAENKTGQIIQKKEKTLSEKLAYALMFQTDDGMLSYLKDIQDKTVQDILKSPRHSIREQIKNLFENM